MRSTSSEQQTGRPARRVRITPPRRSVRRCHEMRGWLIRRCSARSLTLTSPALARRSRMRRRVGLAKARKWSGISFRGFWRNIKVALYASLTHKGSFMYGQPLRGRLRAADQVQELASSPRVAPERAQHAGRDHAAARRLHPAHLDAQVARLDDHAHAARGQRAVEGFGDLPRQLLLDLVTAAKYRD